MPWVVVFSALPRNVIQEWSQFKKFVLSNGILIVIHMKVIENLQESISMHGREPRLRKYGVCRPNVFHI